MNILEYENYQETKDHGHADFPFDIYPCSIPLDFSCVPLHWHEEMEIIYIKKGQGVVTVDFTAYPVTEGEAVFIAPGQLHSIEQECNASMEYENIILNLSLLTGRLSDSCTDSYFHPFINQQLKICTCVRRESEHYEKLISCLNQFDLLCREKPAAYQMELKSVLFHMFFILFSNCRQPVEHRHSGKTLDKIKQILKYVELHYMENLGIGEMAVAAGFSQSHFMRFFKNYMGISFTAYLNDYRLTMAARLLLSSSSGILNIAAETGFENLSYFNRLFKKKYGMSPKEFRNRS